MRTTRLALPLLVTGALAAGCGGGSSTSSSSSSSSKAAGTPAATQAALSPAARLQAASDRSSSAGSSKIALLTTSTVAGKDITVKADGAVDTAKRLGTITLVLGQAAGQSLSIEERFLGEDLYIAVPQQPGTFYKVALKDLVGTSLGSSASPTAGFQALKAASADVTEVGKEKVRDADTTHYKGTYDAKAALDKVDGAAKQVITATLTGSDLTSVPFDAYIDDQGRVRKFVQTLDVTAQGQKVHTTSTIEAFDYGTPVTVAAPPAAQVKDGAPLLDALKNATG